jgi:hypothetical protein
MQMKTVGGDIHQAPIFQHIKSIGFEIETTDLIKFTIEPVKSKKSKSKTQKSKSKKSKSKTRRIEKKHRLINSALTNIDLEYGYLDENEYTDIIDTPQLQFKITNDSAEDSDFNVKLQDLISEHKNEDGDCEDTVFRLNIPNSSGKIAVYDILIKDPDMELRHCSTFTDVEWIITNYNPPISKNIILHTFFDSIRMLKEHLQNLVVLPGSKFCYRNEKNQFVDLNYNTIQQAYSLPGTSLLYYNVSAYEIDNYTITSDLKFVPQMTFSCDVGYAFRIMKKMMEMQYKVPRSNTVIREIVEKNANNENFDVDAIDRSMEIVKAIFKPVKRENDGKLKMYLFLIVYKLYIYLNSYLESKFKHPETMLKKNLSFAVRHSNYVLYLEIKKLLGADFSKVLGEWMNAINKREVLKLIYDYPYPKHERNRIMKELKEVRPDIEKYEAAKMKYDGNPLCFISSYFDHFEKDDVEEDEERDWLVANHIDEKSTKFELRDDTVIIEFRDFPEYCYLYLFVNSDENLQHQISQNNMGTLNLKIIEEYMSS